MFGVLIDLKLILDVLQKRELFYAASAHILACGETGLVEGAVAPVDHATIEQVSNLPYGDFAVQMMAAVQAGAQVLVTRNVQETRAGLLPALA